MSRLDGSQITGLGRDATRTEILRAKNFNALDTRVSTLESGGSGSHVLTGDPNSPPLELSEDQLLWDGDSSDMPGATEWTDLTLLNSWTIVPGRKAQYRRVGDEVQIRAGILGGATNTIAFQLPVGFRTPYNHDLAIPVYDSASSPTHEHGNAFLTTDGNCYFYWYTSTAPEAVNLYTSYSVTA